MPVAAALRRAQIHNLLQAAESWALTPGLRPWVKAALLRSEKKLERLMRRRFARQAAQTLPGVRAQARKLYAEAVRAAESKVFVNLKGDFTKDELAEWNTTLASAQALGGQSALAKLGLEGGGGQYLVTSPQSMAVIASHSVQLIDSVDATTKKKLASTLFNGLSEGEHLDALDKRVAGVMGQSGWRSRMIAQTETINAYSIGSEEVAGDYGIKRMQWVNGQGGACPICVDLHDKIKTIGPTGGNYKGAKYTRIRPPAHPACRCAQDPYIDDDEPIPELKRPAPPPPPTPAPKPKPPAQPKPPQAPTVQAKTLEFDDKWKKVGPQTGSNPGGMYTDPTGQRWYVKFMGDTAKARERSLNEVVATDLYRAAGVNVPEVQMLRYGGGKTGVASRIQQVKKGTPDTLGKVEGVHDGMAVDAWLANWDVVGLEFDNLAINAAGKAIRIDTGGSMLYRAQGAPKGKAWGNVVTEMESLRNKGINPQAARVFGNITETQLRASVERVAAMTDEQIATIVQTRWGLNPKSQGLIDTLKARRNDMRAKYLKAPPTPVPPAAQAAQVVVKTGKWTPDELNALRAAWEDPASAALTNNQIAAKYLQANPGRTPKGVLVKMQNLKLSKATKGKGPPIAKPVAPKLKPVQPGGKWTPEDIDDLKALWGDPELVKRTNRQIAEQYIALHPGRTMNSVLAKMQNLKLSKANKGLGKPTGTAPPVPTSTMGRGLRQLDLDDLPTEYKPKTVPEARSVYRMITNVVKVAKAEGDALRKYSGNAFGPMNRWYRALRSGNPSGGKAVTNLIQRSETVVDLQTFRGISGGYADKMWKRQIGEVFPEEGFTSTTVNSAHAFGGLKLRILVPKGTRSINMDKYGYAEHPGEMELLIQRNTTFKVLERYTVGSQKRMTIRVVDQPTPP